MCERGSHLCRTLFLIAHAIGKREHIGKLMGEGVRIAAQSLGGAAFEFAVHVKGMELPFHDPRSLSSLAAAYATYPRGACHRGMSHALERYGVPELGYAKAMDRFELAGKGKMTAVTQDYFGLYNSAKICQFIGSAVAPSDIVNWINFATGWDMTLEEFMQAGERASNLKRMYNVRCGMTRQDDTLPPRILKEKFTEGGAKDFIPNLEAMLDEYYAHRSWDQNGMPRPKTLAELGLNNEIRDLPGS